MPGLSHRLVAVRVGRSAIVEVGVILVTGGSDMQR